jgi:hypothetical protein
MIAFKTATEADVPEPFLDFTENTKLRRMEVAAPKMLAALRAIMDDTVNLDPHFCADLSRETRSAIREAIAEAEGRDE